MRNVASSAASGGTGKIEGVVTTLRDRIIRGDFEPGLRLREEALAAELGVSRIPLREAFRALESEGFLKSERYGGTFVAGLDEDAAHDLLDVRAALEPLAAAQAAVRRTQDDLDLLARLLDEGRRADRERRYEDIPTLKAQFLEALAAASHNTTLISLMRIVRFKVEWATSIDAIRRVPEEKRLQRTKVMREIVDAIADRDPARAANAVTEHLAATYTGAGWRPVVDLHFQPAE
jgi:DNA-binding GntR family transcriptional regulator